MNIAKQQQWLLTFKISIVVVHLFLLDYFGEENQVRCGICDVCLERNKLEMDDSEFEKIANAIENLITENPLRTDDYHLKNSRV